jgi:hypothetical protein
VEEGVFQGLPEQHGEERAEKNETQQIRPPAGGHEHRNSCEESKGRQPAEHPGEDSPFTHRLAHSRPQDERANHHADAEEQ